MRFPKMYVTACLMEGHAFQRPLASIGVVMAEQDAFVLSYAGKGMTGFPSNVEQITVEHASLCRWPVVRRNDTTLKFPINEGVAQTSKMARAG
jgi:hypothetical protein